MSIITVHVDKMYITASETHAKKKIIAINPYFNLVIESESDILSLPPKLFDAVIKALIVGTVDIPEITTSISTLIELYIALPKEATPCEQ